MKGLTDAEVAEMVKKYGLNEVPEEKEPLWKMFLKQFTGPMQIMIEGAALLCFLIHNWPDFTIIMVLLITNGTLGFFEEKPCFQLASFFSFQTFVGSWLPFKIDQRKQPAPVLFLMNICWAEEERAGLRRRFEGRPREEDAGEAKRQVRQHPRRAGARFQRTRALSFQRSSARKGIDG